MKLNGETTTSNRLIPANGNQLDRRQFIEILKGLSKYSATKGACSRPEVCDAMIVLEKTYKAWRYEQKTTDDFLPEVQYLLGRQQRRHELAQLLFGNGQFLSEDRLVEVFQVLIKAAWLRFQAQLRIYNRNRF